MRVKRGTSHVKRRTKLLKQVKGFRWRRKNTIKLGKVASLKAGVHAYRDRRRKKRDFRRLWTVRINAAARLNDLPYKTLIAKLKAAQIELDRKMLADIAEHEPAVFADIVKAAS